MRNFLRVVLVLFTSATFAQAGHIMQGVGAVNMSMGGAATAMPLDISGAMQWNPAGISGFNGKILDFNIGAFSSSPELSSSLPAGMLGPGAPAVSGVTEDDRGISPMPALAFVWGKEDSKSTFGVSAFGISGFGVTFPEETNNPMSPNFNPMENSNPISYPQQAMGFGHIESDYMLLQVSLTWSYEISKGFSVGVQPNVNYASLELAPNPLASPDFPVEMGGTGKGYPVSDKATAIGYGAQVGLLYASEGGVNVGVSYKTAQTFGDFEFSNTYLDGSAAQDVAFQMDYPAILSLGLGYTNDVFDIAVDYRNVDYTSTEGFEEKGWALAESGPMTGFPTGSVKGFGWKDVNIFSAGLQLKVVDKLPIRFGYTHSTNPIDSDLAFFSIPATAIIKNAYQFGLGYEFSEKIKVNGVYHYGTSGGSTNGSILNPKPDFMGGPWNADTNPLGAMPGTSVGYKMDTSMIMLGISYNFAK